MSIEKLNALIENASSPSDVASEVKNLLKQGYLVEHDEDKSILSILKVDGKNMRMTPGDILHIRAKMEEAAARIFPKNHTHLFVSAGGNGLVFALGSAPTFAEASTIARKEGI